jgi:hypothetical protein
MRLRVNMTRVRRSQKLSRVKLLLGRSAVTLIRADSLQWRLFKARLLLSRRIPPFLLAGSLRPRSIGRRYRRTFGQRWLDVSERPAQL